MFTVGLTGGIGSGKSTVAGLFSELGVPVIDTDLIAHQLVTPGSPALAAIQSAFGDAVMQEDGSLNRAALRQRVFGDASARKTLEAILHPRIRTEVEQALASLEAPYALVVIPLLVETGGCRDLLDRVLVIDCPEALQTSRVMARSGLALAEAQAILAAQASRAERLAAADDVIVNTTSTDVLRAEVETLHQHYLTHAATQAP